MNDTQAAATLSHDSDNPVVPMKPRIRVVIALSFTLVWVVLMIGVTAVYDWQSAGAWLVTAVAAAVFGSGVAVMLRMRHAPAAVAIFVALTLTSIACPALIRGGY